MKKIIERNHVKINEEVKWQDKIYLITGVNDFWIFLKEKDTDIMTLIAKNRYKIVECEE